MKGENYLYFNGQAGEPAATDKACLIPASAVLGMSMGADDGAGHGSRILLSFDGFVGDGNSRAGIVVGHSIGKAAEVMDDIVAAINSTPGDGFVVIGDMKTNTFCSNHITSVAVDSVLAS